MRNNATTDRIAQSLRIDITSLQQELDVAIVENAPMLLIIERQTEAGPFQLVYGDWADERGDIRRGFRSLDMVPNHLCGCARFTREAASANVGALTAHGEKVVALHWKEVLQQRLDRYQQLLAVLEARQDEDMAVA